MEPRAYLIFLVWILRNRPLGKDAKHRALLLFLGMLGLAFTAAAAGQMVQSSANIMCRDGRLMNGALNFNDQGLCIDGWADLLSNSPAACQLWSKLRQRVWLGRCISTDMNQASVQDIFFFLAFLMARPGMRKMSGQVPYTDIAKHMFPMLLASAGQWLDRLAVLKSAANLKALPMLKPKAGHIYKRLDPINRMLLLWKLRKEKVHRRRVAQTHDDMVALQSSFIKYEAFLDTFLHKQALTEAFKGRAKQISLSWDPSSYAGQEIMVVVGYSAALQSGCYLFNQFLAHLRLSDLDDSLVKSAKQKQLDRLEGYNELRGLGKALESIGMHWADFQTPGDLFLRLLHPHEYRLLDPTTGQALILQ